MRRNYQPYPQPRYDNRVTPQPYYDNRVAPQPHYDSNVRPVNHGDSFPQPKVNPYESREKYQKHVDTIYGKDHQITGKDNYRENLRKAAENHKPVVMTFVRGSDPNAKQHLEAIERAKKAAGDKAEFCVIDVDKVDPNSKVGQYAQNHIRDKFGTPLTMVFNQSQGENGGTKPDAPNFWQRGAVNEQALLNGIGKAAEVQKSREIQTRRSDETKPPADKGEKATERERTPSTPEDAAAKELRKKIVAESIKPFDKQNHDELFKGMQPEARTKAMWDAIKAADDTGNTLLSARVRAMAGLATIAWGAEAQKAGDYESATKRYTWGSEFIMSAGMKNPDLYKYPSLQQALRGSYMPGNSADYLLSQGQQNPRWSAATPEEIRANPKAADEKREWARQQIIEEMKKPRVARRPAA